MIGNAADAEDLVQRVRYPLPGGKGGQRGVAFSNRAAGYGAFGGADHIQRSNDGIGVIAMISSPMAVGVVVAAMIGMGIGGIIALATVPPGRPA